jgi:hypothetical protein
MRQAVSVAFFRRAARQVKTAWNAEGGSLSDCNMDFYNTI